MRIPFPCHKCGLDRRSWAFAEITDTAVFGGLCSSGHQIRFRLSYEAPHELLLDAGALALLDEYYRESVSSLAAGLEQSFEFYVEASMAAAGIEPEAIRKLLSVNRFDQRRAGMVSACYLRDTGQVFPYLESKRMEFRNRVIHNATWPTRRETLEFADYVCRSVLGLQSTLGPKMSALLDLKDQQADIAAAEDLLAGLEAPTSLFARASFLAAFSRSPSIDSALSDFKLNGWWSWPWIQASRP